MKRTTTPLTPKGKLKMISFDSHTNFQIFPSKLRIVTNDRLSKKIFELTQDDLHDWIENHKTMNFIEMFNHKKFGEITSPIKLSVDGENFSISEPLDQFDGAVLSVCNSEWIAKNPVTTPSIIYRGLTGKVGKSDAEPSKDQLTAIFNSINKLMRLQLDYDLSDLCEKLKYNGGKPERLISTLLPCHYLKSSTINGKDTTVIYFDREPVLLTVAKIKNCQLLTYDALLLDVPKQNNTPMNIVVKNYVMQRIQEIKLHNLTPIITFDNIFQKCRLENISRDKKMDARNNTVKFLEYLKSQSEIKNFELTKRGNSFYSVKFSYSKKVTRLIQPKHDSE